MRVLCCCFHCCCCVCNQQVTRKEEEEEKGCFVERGGKGGVMALVGGDPELVKFHHVVEQPSSDFTIYMETGM